LEHAGQAQSFHSLWETPLEPVIYTPLVYLIDYGLEWFMEIPGEPVMSVRTIPTSWSENLEMRLLLSVMINFSTKDSLSISYP